MLLHNQNFEIRGPEGPMQIRTEHNGEANVNFIIEITGGIVIWVPETKLHTQNFEIQGP
jgi:hypothetical protein